MQHTNKDNYKDNYKVMSDAMNDQLASMIVSESIQPSPWFERQHMSNKRGLTSQYINLYQRHHQLKKWVLFINPDESSIEALASIHKIDTSQVLMVNFKNSYKNISSEIALKKNIASIKDALSTGNCSAVILSETDFKEDEINELENSARIGETHCVILEKQHTVH